MISKELQDIYKDKFNLEGHCNTNIIFLRELYREQDFQDSYPNFTKVTNFKYRDKITGSEWEVVKASSESCHGRRVKRAIVDSSIDEKIFKEDILPACYASNCIRMEFFIDKI